MANMATLAKDFCSESHSTKWFTLYEDESAYELFKYLLERKLYDGDYSSKIQQLFEKDVSDLDVDDVEVYLTALACLDRTNDGLFTESVMSGLVGSLATRWLELTQD